MTTLESDCAISTDPAVLARIDDADIALAIWQRPPPPGVPEFLAELAAHGPALALDFVLTPGESSKVAPVVRETFSAHLDAPPLHALLDDIDRLVAHFRAVSGEPAVRVRLTRVVDPACALFHVDTLRLRLLCTYHGAGTQWAPESAARRKKLGLHGRTLRKANRAIVPDGALIRELAPWQAAIFKGRTHPTGGKRALIHRSAPQCCAQHARIRLVLDIADEARARRC